MRKWSVRTVDLCKNRLFMRVRLGYFANGGLEIVDFENGDG
jgi:hypothetical protein